MMREKLGLFGIEEEDKFLILDLLTWMHQNNVDYTNTFCHLMDNEIKKDLKYDDEDFLNWKKRWKNRLKTKNIVPEKSIQLMKNTNPIVIPRNHKVEEALKSAEENDLKPINEMLKVLRKPYTKQKDIRDYQIPKVTKEKYQTFCGT